MKGSQWLMMAEVSHSAALSSKELAVYKNPILNSSPDLHLIVVDALAQHKLWPAYILYHGRLYKRGQMGPIPDECKKHSVFGFRTYQRTEHVEESRAHNFLILED
jgi:hypothetical protein